MEAERIVHRQSLPVVSRRELMAVLRAGRPGTLAFSYEAGIESGLDNSEVLARSAAIYLLACAVNLTDDLADGDCTYLEGGVGSGVCVQAILLQLSFCVLLQAAVPTRVLVRMSHDLVAAAGAQLIEMKTRTWRASNFRAVANGIGGRLFSAYLRALWSGTRLAHRASRVGMNLGRAVVVWEDMSSRDNRFLSLPKADRREVVAWAVKAVRSLRRERLRCLNFLLRTIAPDVEGGLQSRERHTAARSSLGAFSSRRTSDQSKRKLAPR
jgi:hypothetical protein